MKLSNLGSRVLTAATLGTLVVAGIYYSGAGLLAVCVLVSVLGLLEYFRLIGKKAVHLETLFSLAAGVMVWGVVTFSFWRDEKYLNYLNGLWLFLPLLSVAMLYRKNEKAAFTQLGLSVLGLIYLVPPFVFWFLLSFPYGLQQTYSPQTALGVLFMHWVADTGAYFGGRFLGKHKLFERISPKKTWEGLAAGLLFTVLFSILLQKFWPVNFHWTPVAVIIVIMGLYGDFVESMLKRNLGVKDSGTILPGHGGILDRFDGFFLSLPCVYLWTLFFN